MNTTMMVITVFIGILVFLVDYFLSYGTLTFWQEKQKSIAVIFFCAIMALTAAYIDTVLKMWVM